MEIPETEKFFLSYMRVLAREIERLNSLLTWKKEYLTEVCELTSNFTVYQSKDNIEICLF